MEDASARIGIRACPHIDLDDARCNSRFGLERIEQAFGVCFGVFHACPMYHQINSEIEHEAVAERRALVMLTTDGSPVPLRATGS